MADEASGNKLFESICGPTYGELGGFFSPMSVSDTSRYLVTVIELIGSVSSACKAWQPGMIDQQEHSNPYTENKTFHGTTI